ncbi:MAG TPA: hypothetical protein VJG13_00280 [Thermoanaerobaculia bacterium]|nr:hypothetical protein [Thermoanaerobaculia bacterium]
MFGGQIDAAFVHVLGGGGQDRSWVDLLTLCLLGADEAEEICGELFEALGHADYSVGLLAFGGVRGQALSKELGVAFHAGQGVADLVGEDRGHLAEGGEAAVALYRGLEAHLA